MSKMEHDASVAVLRQQMSTFAKPWFRSCSEVLEKNKLNGLDCLDLGSGNGEFSQVLRDKFAMNVTCADYIPFHLKQAETLGFETLSVNLEDDAQSVDRIGEAHKERFDIVVNLATIEHVFDSDNLLRFAHTVLRPNGLLLINTPNISFWAYRLYSGLNGNRPYGEGHHIRFWDFRFLRTNLFFNGFEVTGNYQKFFSLPEEILLRSFKNNNFLAKWVAKLFYACFLFQHIPGFKGVATDELTVLSRKEDVSPVGFNYLNLRENLKSGDNEVLRNQICRRIKEAQRRGWLKEHLYTAKLIDEYSS